MAHEEDSSSQKDNLFQDNLYISQLDTIKGTKIRIVFSDNTSLIVLQDLLIKEDLYQGKEISTKDRERIKEVSRSLEAERYALNLLSYRQHSKQSLSMKLIKKGFSRHCIDLLLEKLEDLNYLNDAEFAKAWIASRILRHPEGKKALLAGLIKQGITRAMGEAVINEVVTEDKEIEMAEDVFRKLINLKKPEKKIVAALQARGFPYSIIRQVMKSEMDYE